jgi:hypothetical protein
MNQTLFEISAEYRDILADMDLHAELNEGDITDFPLLERLAAVEGDLSAKALNIAALIKEIEVIGESIIAQGKPFQDLAESYTVRGKSHLNRAERLLKYLEDNVPMNAVYEDSRAKVKWQGNGGSRPTELMPEVKPEELPESFQKITVEANKEAIRTRLEFLLGDGKKPEETGEPLELKNDEGKVLAVVKPRGKSLRIK